jgi:hypothetical protein
MELKHAMLKIGAYFIILRLTIIPLFFTQCAKHNINKNGEDIDEGIKDESISENVSTPEEDAELENDDVSVISEDIEIIGEIIIKPDAKPEICIPECEKKECGSDKCGGICAKCEKGFCGEDGFCHDKCIPDCDGKECGMNGCGYPCKTCSGGCPSFPDCGIEVCDSENKCVGCTPDCTRKECGSNGCTGNCGKCQWGKNCLKNHICADACESCTAYPDCMVYGFESGDLSGFYSEGGVLVISNFESSDPPEGSYMALLTTGGGLTLDQSLLEKYLCPLPGVKKLRFQWRFCSEQFVEWCGSVYQDYFTISIKNPDQKQDLIYLKIDDLCSPEACFGCGSNYMGLVHSENSFDMGNAYCTPWQKENFKTEDFAGIIKTLEPVLLSVFISDGPGSIYDSVLLIDDIRWDFD